MSDPRDVLDALQAAARLGGSEAMGPMVQAFTGEEIAAALRLAVEERLRPVGHWLVPNDSPERVQESFADDLGSIIRYSGDPPVFTAG